jgi:hypothetical protein
MSRRPKTEDRRRKLRNEVTKRSSAKPNSARREPKPKANQSGTDYKSAPAENEVLRMMSKESRNKNKQAARSNQQPATSNQQLAWYFLAFFFAVAFGYFFFFGSYVLFFQEQQSLFLYTGSYIDDFLLKPGSLLDLMGKFLTQFYISKLAGSILLAAVLTLPAIILLQINKRLFPDSGLQNLLILLPSCLLLIMQTHYYHFMMYNLGFLMAILYFMLFVRTENKAVKYIILAFFPVFFYIAGAFSLIFIGLYIFYCLFYIKGTGKYYYPLALIALVLISVFLFSRIFLLQSVKQLFLYPLPFINDTTHKALFYILTGYLVLYPVIGWLAGLPGIKNPGRAIVSIIPPVIVILITVIMLITGYNSQTSRVINLEKLVFEEKWNEAIEFQEKYPSENMIGQYFYNIALSESGQLCDRLFHGRQDFGTASLFLPWSSEHINWGANSFYAIGLINEAQRWAYEEMVVYGQRPQNMKLLLKSSLISGKYSMAEKYTGILENTLFYRKWAEGYEKLIGDTSAIRLHPELGKKVKMLPRSDFFIFLESPEQNLPLLVDQNPDNREAFEYLMSWLLFSKEVEMVVNNIHLMKSMGYTRIPNHIEEAIMIYYNSQGVFPDLGGLSISSETMLRFDQYFTTFMAARQNPATIQEKMRKQFSDTFWYYFHFK